MDYEVSFNGLITLICIFSNVNSRAQFDWHNRISSSFGMHFHLILGKPQWLKVSVIIIRTLMWLYVESSVLVSG